MQDLLSKLNIWIDGLVSNLPQILGFLVVLAVFYLLAKISQKLTRNAAARSGAPHSLETLLGTAVKVVVIIVGIVVGLSLLGLGKAVTTALAGAGVLGIVLGFALQDIAANFISGIILIFRKPFSEGDLVEISGHLGIVTEINLRTTKLRSLKGQMVYIPNQQVFQNDLKNYTELGERRIDVACGVSYSDDLDLARKTAKQAVAALEYIDTDNHEIEVYYNEFGGSSINFTVRFWINFDRQPSFLASQNDAIMAIKTAFEEQDIDIPFPIRTLEFGAKGGTSLSSQLPGN